MKTGGQYGNGDEFYLINDHYRRVRGGTARLLELACANCGHPMMIYQKDGPGPLLRCYINRIFKPDTLAKLQRDQGIREPRDLPNLVCTKCNNVLAYPIRHRDGRLAFSVRQGAIAKKVLRK